LVILQESIKSELGLSDTQLGVLTGLTFALFYVTLGIPIARMADRGNRRNIVALSLAVWSIMTAISGFVVSYWQLVLARIGVGIGEAGGSPPSHSMISDYFPPEKRGTALSIYSSGIYFGILLGYTVGGWLDQYFGWRSAFFVLGVPGILYALLLLFTVREPEKGHMDPEALQIKESSFWEVVSELFSKRTFVFLSLGCGIHTFGIYGVGNFFAPFLARVHAMPVGQIGLWLGLTTGIGGIIGTFMGGYLADRLAYRNIRWYMWLPILAGVLNIIPALISFFSPNVNIVLINYAFSALLTAVYMAPCLAVTHNLVDAKKRALASAILFLMLNAIGLGLGPVFIGLLSDIFTPSYGIESLRYAFCFTILTGLVAAGLFYAASRVYPAESRV
jgi:MFS family permease